MEERAVASTSADETLAFDLSEVTLRAPGGVCVLDDLSWSQRAATSAVIVGPSGAGKSRLLRLLNRLQEPTEGTVRVFGRDVQEWDVRELRQRVGLVAQTPSLSLGTARENLDVVHELGLLSRDLFEERFERSLQAAQIPADLLERPTVHLSGGERQRLAIARALLLEPRALLLDEPTSALDRPTAASILEALKTWRADTGGTLTMVTHRVRDADTLEADTFVLMEGRVVDRSDARAVKFLEGKAS